MFSTTFEMELWGGPQKKLLRGALAKLQSLEVVAARKEGRLSVGRVVAQSVHAPNGGTRIQVAMPRFGGPQLTVLLCLLFALNLLELRAMVARGPVPSVYDAGVKYTREPRGCEIWRTIAVLYRIGRGDCEDIASALAAWLCVVQGEAARPFWRVFKTSAGRLYHILTRRASGRIEDACRALGMGTNGTSNDSLDARRSRARRLLSRQTKAAKTIRRR